MCGEFATNSLYSLIIWLVISEVSSSQEVRRKPGRARRMEVHPEHEQLAMAMLPFGITSSPHHQSSSH